MGAMNVDGVSGIGVRVRVEIWLESQLGDKRPHPHHTNVIIEYLIPYPQCMVIESLLGKCVSTMLMPATRDFPLLLRCMAVGTVCGLFNISASGTAVIIAPTTISCRPGEIIAAICTRPQGQVLEMSPNLLEDLWLLTPTFEDSTFGHRFTVGEDDELDLQMQFVVTFRQVFGYRIHLPRHINSFELPGKRNCIRIFKQCICRLAK